MNPGDRWRVTALAVITTIVLSACGGAAGAPPGPSQEDIAAATQQAASRAATAAAAASRATGAISFTADANVTLAGTLYGAGDTVALLANMQGAVQSTWQPFAQAVAEMGYAAFTFDYRGLGASGGDRSDTTVDQDARAAIDYLRGQGFKNVVLIGASLGGIACARNSHEANVTALALISTPRGFESLVIPAENLTNLDYPKLFVASQDDEPFETDIRTMHSIASVPKDIKLFTGNAHGTNLFDTEHKAELETLLLDLIRKAAGDA